MAEPDRRCQRISPLRRWCCWLPALLLLAITPLAGATEAAAPGLAAIHAQLQSRLRASPFGQPLLLESSERGGTLEGLVQAEIAQPIAAVRSALADPAQWCEVLLLIPNIARCRADGTDGLQLGLVKKVDAALDSALPIRFDFAHRADGDETRIELAAKQGPVGTRDYRIQLRAIGVGAQRSFVQLRYAYAYGLSARLAAQAYLATAGRGKSGFSVISHERQGEPVRVGGLRGAVERNAMRYYLAIDAHLAAQSVMPAERFERSLQLWLAAIARYPEQLREDDVAAYAKAKRRSYRDRVDIAPN